jgi:methionine-R-sulfoxide reductase
MPAYQNPGISALKQGYFLVPMITSMTYALDINRLGRDEGGFMTFTKTKTQDVSQVVSVSLPDELSIDVAYWGAGDVGIYECAQCHLPLFDSSQKFYFGSKWSSFCQPIHQTCVTLREEESPAFAGVSVKCTRCGAHLGRVFSDGPPPTGLRYRMNSDALFLV